VFATEAFLSAKSSEYGWFVSGTLALPYVIDRKLCIRRLILTSEPVHLEPEISPEQERRFLNEVVRICGLSGPASADFISPGQANAVFHVVPDGCEYIRWGSFVVDLRPDEPVIFNTIHPKHRNTIRKATSLGVAVSETDDIALVYNSLRDTMMRQRVLFYPSLAYLERLRRNLHDRISFCTASHEGVVQGVAVIAYNQHGAYYYYGGSVPSPVTGAVNLMHYQIIRSLKGKGIPVYDLMGARLAGYNHPKIEGIQRFKSRFASGVRDGFTFRALIKPLKYRLFVSAVKTHFALRGSSYEGDVIDQSPASRLIGPAAVPAGNIMPVTEFRG